MSRFQVKFRIVNTHHLLSSRQVAAFFLGWVFMSSLSCMLYSSVFQNLLHRCIHGLFITSGDNTSDLKNVSEKSPSIWAGDVHESRLFSKGDNHALVFTLCICLAFASVAYFLSLLSFNPSNGSAACGEYCGRSWYDT
jgi:hypothetical protein